jgi:ring-1,2-phenylacetyl-CoA epoxidase subunit PaaB
MKINSLDPRIARADIPETAETLKPLDQWGTWEVFTQKKRGEHHRHVGSVHAPNMEMAFLFGKEQFGRRGTCVNIWVVQTKDVIASEYEDEDIFSTTSEKTYREASGFKVMDKINKYRKENPASAAVTSTIQTEQNEH